jgi:hypothetical protein
MAIAATTFEFLGGDPSRCQAAENHTWNATGQRCNGIDMLIEPIVQCTALPMTANDPNNMSVPTT